MLVTSSGVFVCLVVGEMVNLGSGIGVAGGFGVRFGCGWCVCGAAEVEVGTDLDGSDDQGPPAVTTGGVSVPRLTGLSEGTCFISD